MGRTAFIEHTCTVTSKGQTTLPKAFRQMLGVPDGGRIVARVEGRRVVLEAAETAAEHFDPAIAKFLALMEADIANGRNVRALPADLEATLQHVLEDDGEVDLNAPIEGESCL